MAQNQAAPPRAQLSHLPRADGSATFSYDGYTVIGSANGPMEVNRRDEDPFGAVVDVIVRPAAGAGGEFRSRGWLVWEGRVVWSLGRRTLKRQQNKLC